MEGLNQLLKKYRLNKWFKRKNLAVLILSGVLLVIITLPIKDDEKNAISDTQREEMVKSTERNTETLQYQESYEYADYLERELEEMLIQMKGVGKVKVMITLEGSRELIVHMDEKVSDNNSMETDSKGGNRTVHQTDMQEETVYVKNGEGESPYVVQTKLPKVSGVLIVAEGAEDGNVKKSITEIAEALLGVSVHKVTVVAME